MGFHEVRLPVGLAWGSSGGVERRTEVTALSSGHELRSSPWAHGRRRYLIGQGVRSVTDAAALLSFFEARRGRLHGFRFRDFADWRSGPGEPAAADQRLGVGDGTRTTFALCKRYGDDEDAYLRPIRKPVAGTVRVAVGGSELPPGGFSVDHAAGTVTLTAAPAAGAEVTAGFAFDTPVRFDSDRLDITLEGFEAGRVAAIPLIEIRI